MTGRNHELIRFDITFWRGAVLEDADPTPETLVDFIERLEETSPLQKKAFIQQDLNVVKKAGSLSLSKIESSGLRAAAVGQEFVEAAA